MLAMPRTCVGGGAAAAAVVVGATADAAGALGLPERLPSLRNVRLMAATVLLRKPPLLLDPDSVCNTYK